MPVTTHYAPRRKSSLSQVLTSDLVPEIEKPKKCYRCEKSVKVSPVETHRRRSSRGCNSLLGSLQESLLHGKTSGFPSRPMKFQSVVSSGLSKPVKLEFDAIFYTWSDGFESPYVGSIKLGDRYKKNGFPGLKVDARGKIQVVICNSEESAVKIILVNYNIRRLRSGYRVFIRQSNENYTIHLNFINVKGRFYLYEDIRVIFNNHVLCANSPDQRLVGKPSKVDLGYFLNKCWYCDEQQPAVEDDDVDILSSKLSSLEMVKDTSSSISDTASNQENEHMEIKLKKDYQIRYISDNESDNDGNNDENNDEYNKNNKHSNDMDDDDNENKEKGNEKDEKDSIGYNYSKVNRSGLLVLGSREFR